MQAANNILLVRVPETETNRLRELRDYILQSLEKTVLVLPEDASWELLELPTLGGVTVEPEEVVTEDAAPEPDTEMNVSLSEEKRTIAQRLKDYRAAHGPGCLAIVSTKTARRKDRRISDDVLREICAGGAPKMPIQDWRCIGNALDALEKKCQNNP